MKTKAISIIINSFFLGIFLFVLYHIDWGKVGGFFSMISWRIWFEIFVLYASLYAAKAVRIHFLNPELSMSKAFSVSIYHNFFIMIMPFNLGELSYLKKLRDHDIRIHKSASDIVLMRAMDVLVVTIIFLGVLVFGGFVASILEMSAVAMLAIAMALAVWKFDAIFRWAGEMPLMKRMARVQRLLGSIAGRAALISVRKKLHMMSISVLIWLLSMLTWPVLLTSVSAISLRDACLATLISVIVSTFPISTPGSVGLVQGGWLLGLTAVGRKASFAADFSILANAVYVLCVGLIFSLWNLYEKLIVWRRSRI